MQIRGNEASIFTGQCPKKLKELIKSDRWKPLDEQNLERDS